MKKYKFSTKANDSDVDSSDAPFDPEIAMAVSNRGGIEYASLPSTRNFGLNLKLSF